LGCEPKPGRLGPVVSGSRLPRPDEAAGRREETKWKRKREKKKGEGLIFRRGPRTSRPGSHRAIRPTTREVDMTKLTVTITELSSRRVWVSPTRTNDPATAIDRAIKRNWGSNAFFWRDSGISGLTIGQICKPVGRNNPGCNNCITGRVKIETV